ncbi:MAG TPA: hypothetical protein VNG71_12925, partial [Pyrinomonadaceae bacterium]|nr:hypothetical protein [Pyrinomonadaceae bacterium]
PVVIAFASINTIEAQDSWQKADAEVVRISPTAFPELPSRISRKLVRLGCTIPQAQGPLPRHNVIKGNFKRPGQTDWAVLCSRQRTSSIMTFWGGSAESFSEIAKISDDVFLQTIDGRGTIGFFRAISPASKTYILQHYREYHGPKPPPLNHQGIEDGFLEKGSTIYYHYRGRWRELQGAD